MTPVDGQLEHRVTLHGGMRTSLCYKESTGVREYQLVTIRDGSDRWGKVQIPSGVYLYILPRAEGSLTCDWLSASPIGDLLWSLGKEFQLWMTLLNIICDSVTGDAVSPSLGSIASAPPPGPRRTLCPREVDRERAMGGGGVCGRPRAQTLPGVRVMAELQRLLSRWEHGPVWPDLLSLPRATGHLHLRVKCPVFKAPQAKNPKQPAAIEGPVLTSQEMTVTPLYAWPPTASLPP